MYESRINIIVKKVSVPCCRLAWLCFKIGRWFLWDVQIWKSKFDAIIPCCLFLAHLKK